MCNPCFSLSSSSDRRRGSKQISWTLDSLESICSLKPCKLIHVENTQTRELLQQQQLLHIQLLSDNTRGNQAYKRGDPLYLRCIVANGYMGSSTGSHCKTHDLPFDKDKQQHKHLHIKTNTKGQDIKFSIIK